MNENEATPTTEAVEKSAEEVAKEGMAASHDENAQVPFTVCGISGAAFQEGDQVVIQTVTPTEAEAAEGQTPYKRAVLLEHLSVEEAEALPEGSVKTFPNFA